MFDYPNGAHTCASAIATTELGVCGGPSLQSTWLEHGTFNVRQIFALKSMRERDKYRLADNLPILGAKDWKSAPNSQYCDNESLNNKKKTSHTNTHGIEMQSIWIRLNHVPFTHGRPNFYSSSAMCIFYSWWIWVVLFSLARIAARQWKSSDFFPFAASKTDKIHKNHHKYEQVYFVCESIHICFSWPCVKAKEKCWKKVQSTQSSIEWQKPFGSNNFKFFILSFLFVECSRFFSSSRFVFGSLSSHSLQIFLSFCITSTFHFRLCMRKREPRKRQRK